MFYCGKVGQEFHSKKVNDKKANVAAEEEKDDEHVELTFHCAGDNHDQTFFYFYQEHGDW